MECVVQLLGGNIKLPQDIMRFLGVDVGDKITFRRDGSVAKTEFGGTEIKADGYVGIPEGVRNSYYLKEEQGVILYEKAGKIYLAQALLHALVELAKGFEDTPDISDEEILQEVRKARYGDDYED